MKASKSLLTVLGLIALSACSNQPGGQVLTQEESLAKIPVKASAAPGTVTISAYDAGVIFANTCLVRGPNFDNYAYGLRVHNVTRNSDTGTFYHNRYDASVRVDNGQCSMVFFAEAPISNVIADSAKGVASIIYPAPKGIDLTSRPSPFKKGRYFRFGIEAPVVLDPNARRGG